MTPLDQAHAAMRAAGDDDFARRLYHVTLAASRLLVPLERPSEGEVIEPLVLQVEGASLALAFDSEDRLGASLPSGAAYAALLGADLMQMLAPAGLGLAVNPDAAPSAEILPPALPRWIADRMEEAAAPDPGDPGAPAAPEPLPLELLKVLEALRPALAHVTRKLLLVAETGAPDRYGIALLDVAPGDRADCETVIRRGLAIAGLRQDAVRISFLAEGDAAAQAFARIGLALAMPEVGDSAPHRDPARPPRLI